MRIDPAYTAVATLPLGSRRTILNDQLTPTGLFDPTQRLNQKTPPV